VQRGGAVYLEAGSVADLPLAAGRRLVRRAIELAKGDLRGVSFAHIGSILDLASSPRGHGCVHAPGLAVLRSFDWLRLATPGAAADGAPYRQPAAVPGALRIPGAGLEVRLELIENPETLEHADCVYNSVMGGLDWQRLSGPLEWRNWRAGDRYRPMGSTGEEKIKTLFQRAQIPLWERRLWPVLTNGPSIVWVRRFGPAAGYEASQDSRRVLAIREAVAPDESGIGIGRDGV